MTALQDRDEPETTGRETERGRAMVEELLWVHLLAHVDYEERNPGPTVRRLDPLGS
jgi:hypothetical protein